MAIEHFKSVLVPEHFRNTLHPCRRWFRPVHCRLLAWLVTKPTHSQVLNLQG